MPQRLAEVPLNTELLPGARNAIRNCLRLQPHERVTLITDHCTRAIGAALYREIAAVGAPCDVFILEDFGDRPHTDMPRDILDALARSQVSLYAVRGETGELRTRMQMTSVVTEHRIRHGHMINISERIMTEGMLADFPAVDDLSSRVMNIARRARTAHATTPLGTDIRVELSPHLRWIKTSGIISPDAWGNLPGGEIFTAPARIDGTMVVDGVVGDYLCAKYGNLMATPLTIDIVASRITTIRCANAALKKEFWDYCHTDGNSDRVGEFAIGTNLAVRHVIGEILQDEKMPGLHIAFGHPYAEHTGADWESSTHIDVVATGFDIWFDDIQIMRRGEFTL